LPAVEQAGGAKLARGGENRCDRGGNGETATELQAMGAAGGTHGDAPSVKPQEEPVRTTRAVSRNYASENGEDLEGQAERGQGSNVSADHPSQQIGLQQKSTIAAPAPPARKTRLLPAETRPSTAQKEPPP
jgi:hypothetical protein